MLLDYGGLSSALDLLKKGMDLVGEDADDFRNLAKSAIDSKVLNMQGYAVSPESILARKSGIIPNNNNELLFKGVTMRSFSFVFKMSPRSSDEALQLEVLSDGLNSLWQRRKKLPMVVLVLLGRLFLPGYSTCI